MLHPFLTVSFLAALNQPAILFQPANGLVTLSPAPGVQVFYPGLGNISCFRIPSIVQVPQWGVLVAFAEARHSSCGDDKVYELATRISHDGGATWGPLGFAVGNSTYRTGNPCAVALTSGRLLLTFSMHTAGCGGNCVTGNAYVTSDDGGASWSDPIEITGQIGAAARGRVGPGVALQLTAGSHIGRILVPLSQGTYTQDQVILSDDEGITWSLSKNGTANASFAKMDEAQLTQLPNGSVLLLMRHVAEPWMGKGVSISHDGGDSFSPLSYLKALEGPVCQASIATINSTVFYSGDNSTSHVRQHLTIYRSPDSGSTWPAAIRLVFDGPSGYSCLVPGAIEGDGGVLYEKISGVILFDRFPLDFTPNAFRPVTGAALATLGSKIAHAGRAWPRGRWERVR